MDGNWLLLCIAKSLDFDTNLLLSALIFKWRWCYAIQALPRSYSWVALTAAGEAISLLVAVPRNMCVTSLALSMHFAFLYAGFLQQYSWQHPSPTLNKHSLSVLLPPAQHSYMLYYYCCLMHHVVLHSYNILLCFFWPNTCYSVCIAEFGVNFEEMCIEES